VVISRGGAEIRTVTKFDYFGERSLIFDNYVTATCIAYGNVTLWVVYKNDFIDLLNDNMR